MPVRVRDNEHHISHGVAFTVLSVLSFGLAACSVPDKAPRDDEEKLVQAALGMLNGKGEPVCVDATTVGGPLSVFRSIASNPPPGAAPPAWFLPTGFSPTAALSAADLYRGARADGAVHIDQPTNGTSVVSMPAQAMLDRAAWLLSAQDADRRITIAPSWQPGIKARWWLRNRVSRHCSPNYQISNPVRARDIGFVTVTADHWATTYAFKRSGSGWAARAQWSNWIY
ncbi:MAG: hypothetical protein JWR80_6988 [Bradyrhizobium sp.]|nr:hypothetical protein [Bradyrhizobium sp.]